MSKNSLFHFSIILFAFAATCVAIAFGSYFRSGLVVAVGAPSEIRVRAPQDRNVENFLATERNRQEALILAHGLEQNYASDPAEWLITLNNLELLQDVLVEIRQAYALELEALEEAIAEWRILVEEQEAADALALLQWELAHAQAIVEDTPPDEMPLPPEIPLPLPEPEWTGESLAQFAQITPMFSEFNQMHVVDMSDEDFTMMWTAIFEIAENVQSTVIREIDFATQGTVLSNIRNRAGFERATEDIIEFIVMNRLRPNAIPNDELNQINFDMVRSNYDVEIFVAGQIIIDEGEIVTDDIYYVLEHLGMLQADSLMDNILPLVGVIVVVAAVFFACLMYLSFYRPTIVNNKKETMLLLTLYLLTLILVWALSDFNIPLFPLLIFPMLVAVLIDRRTSAMLTFSMVFIAFFVADGSLTFMLFYTTSGLLICLLSRYTTERSKVFLVGAAIMVVQFVLSVAITFIVDRNFALDDMTELMMSASFAALSGLLTVIICTGSLPLWETLFGVVTPVKLLDLTNPTNLLLRRLTIEAPGTYHHSLVVANLAERAAYDIEANSHAARVGGYYHDVGKLKFPHYFAENLDGDNPHDHLDPINSTQLIISHVSYGLTLASEHRLPQFVRDIIKEHHGTTRLQFFYAKAKERDPDVDDKDFRYPYTIPQTRESACVMLADSVEAAVRSMVPKMKSVDEVETTIRNIIRGKLHDGQLADSQLSIRDVSVIEQSFFRVLKGMYHERIAYPKAPSPEPSAAEGVVRT